MRYINSNQTIQVPSKKIPLSSFALESVTDYGDKVEVMLSHPSYNTNKLMTLWEGQDYIDIGNWTDANVDTRMEELKDNLM